MGHQTPRRFPWLCVLVLVLLNCGDASARHMKSWSPQELVDESDAIVVGEVERITEGERIPKDAEWRLPVVMMRARVRVLRSTPSDAPHTPDAGSTIVVTYKNLTGTGAMNIMPVRLAEGDRYAFPLTFPGPRQADWRLIGDEDYGGLLTPCVRAATQEGLEGEAFLIHEYIGTLAFGDLRSLARAARCLREYPRLAGGQVDAQTLERIHDGLADRLDEGDDRWLDIAAAVHCSFGTPKPATMAELVDGGAGRGDVALMATLALSHVDREGVHERLIEAIIGGLGEFRGNAWNTVRDNYADHPLTTRLLVEALEADQPGTVGLAEYLIRSASTVDGKWEPDLVASAEYPLYAPAEASARRWMVRPQGEMDANRYDADMRRAVLFLQLHGGDDAYGVAMAALRDAKANDPERFHILGQWLIDDDAPRAIAAWRLCIDDAELLRSTVSAMMRATGERFGWEQDRDWYEQDWDGMATQAKAWLDAQ